MPESGQGGNGDSAPRSTGSAPLFRALDWAVRAHRNQRRKVVRSPFAIHPLRVAALLQAYGLPEEPFAVAALLHDTVEHGRVGLREIRREFGEEVAQLVGAVSPAGGRGSWRTRKAAVIARLQNAPEAVLILACADKLDNLLSFRDDEARLGSAVWRKMRRSREDYAWYNTALAGVFAARVDAGLRCPLLIEFCDEARRLFGVRARLPKP